MASPDRAELNRPADDRPARNLGPDVTTETQALFLVRLQSLVEKRLRGGKFDGEQIRQLDKAIYSTFCDCLGLGVSAQARDILREVQES